jgi:hypothetical protein
MEFDNFSNAPAERTVFESNLDNYGRGGLARVAVAPEEKTDKQLRQL